MKNLQTFPVLSKLYEDTVFFHNLTLKGLIGGQCGKSSIVVRFTRDEYNGDEEPTVGTVRVFQF